MEIKWKLVTFEIDLIVVFKISGFPSADNLTYFRNWSWSVYFSSQISEHSVHLSKRFLIIVKHNDSWRTKALYN